MFLLLDMLLIFWKRLTPPCAFGGIHEKCQAHIHCVYSYWNIYFLNNKYSLPTYQLVPLIRNCKTLPIPFESPLIFFFKSITVVSYDNNFHFCHRIFISMMRHSLSIITPMPKSAANICIYVLTLPLCPPPFMVFCSIIASSVMHSCLALLPIKIQFISGAHKYSWYSHYVSYSKLTRNKDDKSLLSYKIHKYSRCPHYIYHSNLVRNEDKISLLVQWCSSVTIEAI